jgi:hypothetical protein
VKIPEKERKMNFNQRSACEAPVCWSKYQTDEFEKREKKRVERARERVCVCLIFSEDERESLSERDLKKTTVD